MKTPPRPTISTGPNRGSRTQPTITSTPREVSTIVSTDTAGGSRPASMVAYAARTASASRSPSTTPPPSDLCSRPIALSTIGNASSAARAPPPALPRLRTVWAGVKETPASANSPRAPSYDASVTGAAAARESQVVLLDERRSTSPASTAAARSTSRCTGIPAARSSIPVWPVGIDRVHDDRLGLARHELRHHSRGGDLEGREGGHLGRVAAEVAGDQHAVDLVRGQQSRHGPDVGHRVLLPRAGEVDRVGHRGARPQQGAQRRARASESTGVSRPTAASASAAIAP